MTKSHCVLEKLYPIKPKKKKKNVKSCIILALIIIEDNGEGPAMLSRELWMSRELPECSDSDRLKRRAGWESLLVLKRTLLVVPVYCRILRANGHRFCARSPAAGPDIEGCRIGQFTLVLGCSPPESRGVPVRQGVRSVLIFEPIRQAPLMSWSWAESCMPTDIRHVDVVVCSADTAFRRWSGILSIESLILPSGRAEGGSVTHGHDSHLFIPS